MASLLAEELLNMILSDALSVPEEMFRQLSTGTFTHPEHNYMPPSSLLLVCKRWLRICTPLLYKVVVIRSIAQAQALEDSFAQNPVFGKFVKKLRIEGSYARFERILKRCPNIEALFLTLNISGNASSAGLCRGLSHINPTEFILHNSWSRRNNNVKMLVNSVCENMPKWSNLIRLYCPYYGLCLHPDLIEAIQKSNGIKRVVLEESRMDDPSLDTSALCKLAAAYNQGASLEVHCCTSSVVSHFVKDIPNKYLSRINICDRSALKSVVSVTKAEPEAVSLKSPSVSLVSARYETCWDDILILLASPSKEGRYEQLIRTRKTLSLVCTLFRDIVRPHFFKSPVFVFPRTFLHFADTLRHNPSLGASVRDLCFDSITRKHNGFNAALISTLPCLPCLRNFQGPRYMSVSALYSLGQTSGRSILSLTNLHVNGESLNGDVWNFFPNLRRLEIKQLPCLIFTDFVDPGGLRNLTSLSLEGAETPHNMLENVFPYLQLPMLNSVELDSTDGVVVELFLNSHGHKIIDFTVYGDTINPCVLEWCPNLVSLRWRESSLEHDMFEGFPHHANLKKLTLGDSSPFNNEKKITRMHPNMNFLTSTDFTRFPALEELQISDYVWPKEQYEIEDAFIPKLAVELQCRHGKLVVTDYAGKRWRPRAQRRR